MYNAQENRDLATLDRMQAGVDQANVNQANANASQQAAIGSIIGGVSNMGSALIQSGSLTGSKKPVVKTPVVETVVETVVDEVYVPTEEEQQQIDNGLN
jgi:hypothetical protein